MGGLPDDSNATTTTTRRGDGAGVNRTFAADDDYDAVGTDDDDVRMTTTTTTGGKRTPTTRTVLKEDALMDDSDDDSECLTRTGRRRRGPTTTPTTPTTTGGQRRASEDYADRLTRKGGPNTTARGNDRYECNICFDTAQDPVVTRCGHLYCWACIHRWLEGARARGAQSTAACPVCKAEVTEDALIPLYGHGEDGGGDDRRALRFRGKMRSAHHRRSGSDVLAALEPASRGLAALLGLRVGDDLTLAQANQLLLSRVLLTIGTLVVIALLVI